MKFTARVPIRGWLWLEVEAGSAYEAEADAILLAARLEGATHALCDHLLQVTDAPLGRVTLVPHPAEADTEGGEEVS